MTDKISFSVRGFEGPMCLYFNEPVDFHVLSRSTGEVICLIPRLDLEVAGDDLETVIDRTVRAIRVLTYTFQTCDVEQLSEAERSQRLAFLQAVDIHRTFEMMTGGIH